jgi:hypothetical protein
VQQDERGKTVWFELALGARDSDVDEEDPGAVGRTPPTAAPLIDADLGPFIAG